MKRILFFHVLLFSCLTIYSQDIGGDYYVSPNGNDSWEGTYSRPWLTWQKAFNTAYAGDTVYIMGGTYYTTKTIQIFPTNGMGHSGLPGQPICYFGYPGQTVILDCKLHCEQPKPSWGYIYNSGITIQEAEHLHFRNFTVRNVFMCDSNRTTGAIAAASTANLTFENITIHQVGQRGYWINPGAWTAADGPDSPFKSDTTRWINCDVYDLCDTIVNNPGNAADGWKVHTYENNYYYWEGCRAWAYSDDGIDVSGQGKRVLINCWVMPTDKYEGVDPAGGIETNGFKLGAVNPAYSRNQNINYITVQNCIAANGEGTGFYDLDYETYRTTNALYSNNSAYRMGIGFRSNSENQQETTAWINNLTYASTSISSVNEPLEVAIIDADGKYTESHNTWDAVNTGYPWFRQTDSVTVSTDDFMSLDYWQLTLPRQQNGSLPEISFLRPKAGSDLIDKGKDTGLSFIGSAPDIGALEYKPMTGNRCPSVRLVYPESESSILQPFNIIVNVIDDDVVSNVEIFDSNKEIAELTIAPWSFPFNSSPGIHYLRAVVTDNAGCKVTSALVPVNVVSGDITLFPNPNNGSFTLLAAYSREGTSQISIVSIDGRMVHKEILLPAETIKNFDLPFLSPGYYILLIANHNSTISKIFIKQ